MNQSLDSPAFYRLTYLQSHLHVYITKALDRFDSYKHNNGISKSLVQLYVNLQLYLNELMDFPNLYH